MGEGGGGGGVCLHARVCLSGSACMRVRACMSAPLLCVCSRVCGYTCWCVFARIYSHRWPSLATSGFHRSALQDKSGLISWEVRLRACARAAWALFEDGHFADGRARLSCATLRCGSFEYA